MCGLLGHPQGLPVPPVPSPSPGQHLLSWVTRGLISWGRASTGPLLSISLIGNISQQEPNAGDCPGLTRHKQGSATLGCEPEAPLKWLLAQAPLVPPCCAQKLWHQAEQYIKALPAPAAHHPGQAQRRRTGKMGRQGQGPHGAGARESGAFPL